jgi:hypothetical protein
MTNLILDPDEWYDWKIINFFKYTSSVQVRLMQQSHNRDIPENEALNDMWRYFLNEAEQLGHRDDNKIVIEIQKNGRSFYIGCYDGVVSIGLDVTTR